MMFNLLSELKEKLKVAVSDKPSGGAGAAAINNTNSAESAKLKAEKQELERFSAALQDDVKALRESVSRLNQMNSELQRDSGVYCVFIVILE